MNDQFNNRSYNISIIQNMSYIDTIYILYDGVPVTSDKRHFISAFYLT